MDAQLWHLYRTEKVKRGKAISKGEVRSIPKYFSDPKSEWFWDRKKGNLILARERADGTWLKVVIEMNWNFGSDRLINAIRTSGLIDEDESALGEVRIALSIAVDVVVYGGDAGTADRRAKEIVARVRALLRGQMSAGGSMLDGFASGGDVVLDDRTAFSVVEEKGGWVAEGATGFDVVVFSGVR